MYRQKNVFLDIYIYIYILFLEILRYFPGLFLQIQSFQCLYFEFFWGFILFYSLVTSVTTNWKKKAKKNSEKGPFLPKGAAGGKTINQRQKSSAGARKLPAYWAAPSSLYLTQTVPRHEEKNTFCELFLEPQFRRTN